MLTVARNRWYAASVVAALVATALTVGVQRATGVGFPFIAGVAMITVILGGRGPALVGGIGTIVLVSLYPPIGRLYGTSVPDVVRLIANSGLLVLAAWLGGRWRESRLATAEREARLREAANSMQELLDASTDGMLLTDAASIVTAVNSTLEQLVGLTSEQLVGCSLEALRVLVARDTPPILLDRLRKGENILVERELRRADGRLISVEASLRMLPGGRVFASLRDITERRQSQERQQAERNLLDAILATSVAAVIVVDLEGRIVFANARGEEVLGLVRDGTPEQPYDEPVWRRLRLDGTIMPDTERPCFRVIATGAPIFDVRHAIEWPDGRRTFLSVNGAPLRGEDGAVRTVVLAISDITLAMAADAALRAHDAELERLTEAMPGMVYKYYRDAHGIEKFLYVSRFATTLLGRSPAEILADPRSAWQHIHPDDALELGRTMTESYRSLQPWTHEFRLRDASNPGSWRWLAGRAIPEAVAGSDAVVWAGLLVEVTERKRLEAELRQVQKMDSVGRLAGGIAHDFNNLLTAILGHAELLAMDIPADADAADSVAQIRAAAVSGSALTRQLLGFARKQVVAPQVVDVNTLVGRLPSLMGRLVGDAVQLETTLAPEAWRVRVDPAQLDQVLMNLVVNAMDAMPAGGRLQIATSHIAAAARRAEDAAIAAGDLVEIVVRDSGDGMTDDVRAHAFEPFYTTKEHGKGTGLGLATSYGIISQAGGLIVIETRVGEGTAVRVLLPVSHEPVTQRPSAPADAATGNEIVLVVDDDSRVRTITAQSLRSYGYTVIEANGGIEALEVARHEPGVIHLLVTDVVMPGMSGRVLADALQRERPSLRVLYVSGYTAGPLGDHGVSSGAVSLLEKPYDRAELARRTRLVLDGAATREHT